jgi:hypothetical protein
MNSMQTDPSGALHPMIAFNVSTAYTKYTEGGLQGNPQVDQELSTGRGFFLIHYIHFLLYLLEQLVYPAQPHAL